MCAFVMSCNCGGFDMPVFRHTLSCQPPCSTIHVVFKSDSRDTHLRRYVMAGCNKLHITTTVTNKILLLFFVVVLLRILRISANLIAWGHLVCNKSVADDVVRLLSSE